MIVQTLRSRALLNCIGGSLILGQVPLVVDFLSVAHVGSGMTCIAAIYLLEDFIIFIE
jgi:hypothetical protein